MLKRLIVFIIILAVLMLNNTVMGSTEVNSTGMDITLKGAANATIVKPADATLRESFAADELQKYIQKISGAFLQIKLDSDIVTGNMILIGGPERNTKTASVISQTTFDAVVPGPEGMMIKTFGKDKLVLAGSSKNPYEYERGTLYAVYEFLEANLGCSFAAYGKPGMDIGEYVPDIATISIGTIDYTKSKADNPYRAAIVQYYRDISHSHGLSVSFIDWMVKNRYNRINTMASVYEDLKANGILDEAMKRGIQFTVGHHESSMLFLPPDGNDYFPEHYYTTHPEYYRLQSDGTRYHAESKWNGQWIFDSRNQNAITQVADNIKTWLSQNPYVDTVNLWPNDLTTSQCTCSKCAPYSKIENYAYFVNEVAKKIKTDYPNNKIDMLVYMDLWDYPSGLELDSSVIVDESTWASYGMRTLGKNDGTSLLGTKYEDNAKAWAAGGSTVVYYDYYMGNFGTQQVYFPMADELDNTYSYFKTNGYAKGSGTQIESYNIWNYIFNFYMHGRTGYNTDLTLNDNLDRFCKIFGAGASNIKKYFLYVEGFFEGQADGTSSGKWFAKKVNKTTVYNYFNKAYAAEPEGKLRNNIRMLRMSFRYADLYTNGGGESELKYMYDNFDSYAHNLGYGISIRAKGSGTYKPDGWYKFYKSPPSAPILNSTALGNSEITLNYISPEATGYKIKYGTESGNYATTIDAGNKTAYTVTGLKNGVTYYFAVEAYNSSGSSPNSNEKSASPDASVVSLRYDFGTKASSLAKGYTRVTEATQYTPGSFGWASISGNKSSDRALGADLKRDFVYNSVAKTFRVDLPNGNYTVNVTLGDATNSHDNLLIKADGVTKASKINTKAGEWYTASYKVAIKGGSLSLEFSDAGGKDPNWVVNAVEITGTKYLINSSFDSEAVGNMPADYTITEGDSTSFRVSKEQAASMSNSVIIDDSTASAYVQATKNFIPASNVTLELKIKPITPTNLDIFLKSGYTIGPRLYLRKNGQISYYLESKFYDVGAYNANQWNTIKIAADCGTDTYSIYLNGVLKKSGVPFYEKLDVIDTMLVRSGMSTVGTLYIDDVKAW